MALDEKLEQPINKLIEELKKSDEYIEFEKYNKVIKQDPILANKIKRTREIRLELSRMSEYDRNGDYAERLETEYDDLCDITAIHKFSLAELNFCNLYQKVLGKIVDSFDIDVRSL